MDRYEEALERAKAGKPMDEVFPELKESEEKKEEATRKELITFVCQFAPEQLKAKYVDFLENHKEQPAEWSEEDEKIINGLIRGLKAKRDVFHHTTFSNDEIDITKAIVWLMALRPQPHWKPSNLELGALRTAISVLTEERNFQIAGKHLQDILDHFKGKETRHDWKPSKEQMKAMEEVRTIFHNHHLWDEINPILYDYEELMRDLKKLM